MGLGNTDGGMATHRLGAGRLSDVSGYEEALTMEPSDGCWRVIYAGELPWLEVGDWLVAMGKVWTCREIREREFTFTEGWQPDSASGLLDPDLPRDIDPPSPK